jgi:hypothetical protein
MIPYIKAIIESGAQLTIPLWQVLLFLVVTCVAAVLERHRLVLVISYVFLVNWVFIENLRLLSFNEISVVTVCAFAFFGLSGLILTLYQMLTARY